MDKPGYSPTQVAGVTGGNYHNILYWARVGLVRASVRNVHKQWEPVLFSFDDVVEVAIVVQLREWGFPPSCAKRAITALRRTHGRSGVCIDVSVVNFCTITSLAQHHKAGKGFTCMVDVDSLRGELEAKIAKSRQTRRARRSQITSRTTASAHAHV